MRKKKCVPSHLLATIYTTPFFDSDEEVVKTVLGCLTGEPGAQANPPGMPRGTPWAGPKHPHRIQVKMVNPGVDPMVTRGWGQGGAECHAIKGSWQVRITRRQSSHRSGRHRWRRSIPWGMEHLRSRSLVHTTGHSNNCK